MSVIELGHPGSTHEAERVLSGWGRTAPVRCRVLSARGVEEIPELLHRQAAAGAGVIARGAGRSYGDAAQLTGGVVLDTSACRAIVWIDRERRLVRAQAGATVASLSAALAREGLMLPVVPGTRHVTLAGAIASDIHGKNHHADGSLARHVRSISLCTPAAGVAEVSPEADPELFYATLGGLGLTGIVLEATVAVEALASGWAAVDTDRTEGLDQTLELLASSERSRFSVAWVDLLAPGARMGRAVLECAEQLPAEQAPAGGRARYAAGLERGALASVPERWPARPPAAGVRAFNAARWRIAPRRERGHPRRLDGYFFPLDALGGWNRLYGRDGLAQHQFVIPDGREDALEAAFAVMRARRMPVYLAVLKRFGPEFGGPLSFPLQGVTLAIDVPARAPGVAAALDRLDEVVAGAGGRVYLTKDSRMRGELLGAMYPRLHEFRTIRGRVDPDGILRSDLSQRLGLVEAGS